ncbi:FAD-dependent oxidoreductase [Yinghuangia aomiensis]
MLGELPAGTVKQGYELVAVKRNTSGSYTATFNRSGTLVDVVADHLVLALPFRMLRLVDLSCAGLSARKTAAITQQGMGHNAKLVLQLTKKTWPAAGKQRRHQHRPERLPKLLGRFGRDRRQRLPRAARQFPRRRHGRATAIPAPRTARRRPPTSSPSSTRSRSCCPAPGPPSTGRPTRTTGPTTAGTTSSYHYSRHRPVRPRLAGYEGVQEGRIHFAGEHTDVDNATLNSAVASGERAATEVAAQI